METNVHSFLRLLTEINGGWMDKWADGYTTKKNGCGSARQVWKWNRVISDEYCEATTISEVDGQKQKIG